MVSVTRLSEEKKRLHAILLPQLPDENGRRWTGSYPYLTPKRLRDSKNSVGVHNEIHVLEFVAP
jgi:hypothetical protein